MLRAVFYIMLCPGAPSPPVIVRATPNTTEQGIRTMTMISEKAVALLLAVALSGTAFQTFIL